MSTVTTVTEEMLTEEMSHPALKDLGWVFEADHETEMRRMVNSSLALETKWYSLPGEARDEARLMQDLYDKSLKLEESKQDSPATNAQSHPTDPAPYVPASTIQLLDVELLRTDGGTQPRAELDMTKIADYAEAMLSGQSFPAVICYYDGADYWLADGFHRRAATVQAELAEIAADVRQGTRRDAVLYSVGANASHGLPRSNADKRRAVTTLLTDEEWAMWSDSEIARRAQVSQPFVSAIRRELTQNGFKSSLRKTSDGRIIDTANIGAPSKDDQPSSQEALFEEPEGESAQENPVDREDVPDIAPSSPASKLKRGHKLAVCDECGERFSDVQIRTDEFFTCQACVDNANQETQALIDVYDKAHPVPEQTGDAWLDRSIKLTVTYSPSQGAKHGRTVYLDIEVGDEVFSGIAIRDHQLAPFTGPVGKLLSDVQEKLQARALVKAQKKSKHPAKSKAHKETAREQVAQPVSAQPETKSQQSYFDGNAHEFTPKSDRETICALCFQGRNGKAHRAWRTQQQQDFAVHEKISLAKLPEDLKAAGWRLVSETTLSGSGSYYCMNKHTKTKTGYYLKAQEAIKAARRIQPKAAMNEAHL